MNNIVYEVIKTFNGLELWEQDKFLSYIAQEVQYWRNNMFRQKSICKDEEEAEQRIKSFLFSLLTVQHPDNIKRFETSECYALRKLVREWKHDTPQQNCAACSERETCIVYTTANDPTRTFPCYYWSPE